MSIGLDDLHGWDEKILKWVEHFKLKCYPQEFEICDHNEMLGYMAYSGMPSHYAHWSYGKSFERQKMMYDYGVSGLPYEMVINSNPCLAYLMRDNSLLLQILTIAHVYGHNDFFANNFTFTSGTRADYVLEMFKSHARRIDTYIDDPSIGIDEVEKVLDAAHALSMQTSRNLAIKKLTPEEQQKKLWKGASGQDDAWQSIHKNEPFVAPNLNKIPLEPEERILSFIATYHPNMPEWKRDILRIVDQETQYFLPQMETKIMNEGWASYWHFKIMNALQLEQGLHMEFLVKHNQVLRPHPGGLNPYHLGFVLWHDIERRWNEQAGEFPKKTIQEEIAVTFEADSPGRSKMFEVRESDRDTSFLRRFLTHDLMRELELFQHDQRGNERVITKVSDDDNWETVKNNLIASVGTGSIPTIKIEDADFGRNRTLYLKHYHDGRDLELAYADPTLRHIKSLWENDVVLETVLDGKATLLQFKDDEIVQQKI